MAGRGWRLVRFGGDARLGVIAPDAPDVVREIAASDPLQALEAGLATAVGVAEHRLADLALRVPLEAPEVWCAGVTYERSRSARVEESASAKDVYDRVYSADRPEIFLKDAGMRRTVGPGEPVSLRPESTWTVPEPELAVVLGAGGVPIGYTVGNDLTARDIEAANPLYIPQAKMFRNAAAFGPAILVPDDWDAPFPITCRIWDESGALIFEQSTSTAAMTRAPAELASWVCRDNPVPAGSVLMTGTGIVPPDDIALAPGYRCEVEIEGIGALANPVVASASLA